MIRYPAAAHLTRNGHQPEATAGSVKCLGYPCGFVGYNEGFRAKLGTHGAMCMIRRCYWWWRQEYRTLMLWYAGQVPGETGAWVRTRILGRYLGALGGNTRIGHGFRITNPEKVRIGAHCDFNEGVFITGGGGVTIGDYVGLGPGVKIWSVNHRYADPEIPWMKQGYEMLQVVIEDDVWLGANCFVMPGTHIGRGSILSAGTVLMKSVPAFAIVAGNPGRIVGWRKQPAQIVKE